MRQWVCNVRVRHSSNCSVSVRLRRLTALATSSNSHEGLCHVAHFLRDSPRPQTSLSSHLLQVGRIDCSESSDLGMECSCSISGYRHRSSIGPEVVARITGIASIAIAFSLCCAFPPFCPEKLRQFFPHDAPP